MKAKGARLSDETPVGCVVLEQGEDFDLDQLLVQCAKWEAEVQVGRETHYMIQFPGLECQLYTRRALEGSLRQL